MPETKASQLEPPFSRQTLFSDNFLAERLPAHPCWVKDGLPELHKQLTAALEAFRDVRKPRDEENTRHEWIDKVLAILGWHYDREAKTRSGRPDYALFPSHDDRRQAVKALQDGVAPYYRHAATILEAKYWDRPLDNVVRSDRFDTSDAAGQLVRYLSDLDIHTDSRLQWGMLTNGRVWRLFWHRARSRATNYYEVDLVDVLDNPHETSGDFARLQYFVRFFEPAAFRLDPATDENRLDSFVNLSETYALRVTENLKQRIFDPGDGVFIRFARGFRQFASDQGQPLEVEGHDSELFTGTVTLLYRLLFLLYAESRDLLPTREAGYFRYSLRRICGDAADIVDGKTVVAETSTDLWTDLLDLFGIIRSGSRNLNVPVYNGGLFEPCYAAADDFEIDADNLSDYFEDNAIYDEAMAYALDALAREADDEDRPAVIDYKALGVRQLGSIYEGLLEFQLRIADEPLAAVREKNREVWKPEPAVNGKAAVVGRIEADDLYMVTTRGERKNTGSYYTPDYLVRAIIDRAVNPVLEERLDHAVELFADYAAAQHKAEDKRLARNSRRYAKADVEAVRRTLFSTIFDMRVLDPAMGSGHFLVEAADHIADRLIDFLNSDRVKNALDRVAPDRDRQPDRTDPENPVLALIGDQRDRILQEMERQEVTIDDAKLTDNNLIKRLVMKRCLYGVDLNPMAVELAKLSLWLHSFTLGAPLSFLDHHLRAGNSLIGIRDISQVIAPGSSAFAQFQHAMQFLLKIGSRPDATLGEVRQDRTDFEQAQVILEPYRRRFDFRLAARGFVNLQTGVNEGRLEKRYEIGWTVNNKGLNELEMEKLGAVGEAAHTHNFFHWQIEFPEAFYDAKGRRDNAGFDAVVGNPPWERMKLQDIEFFGLRDPAIAAAPTAAKRRRMILDLEGDNPDLFDDYADAQEQCKREMDYVRKSGDYPLLGRGDMNLYSLFVERAENLTAPHGRTGLLTPSGIASDNTSKDFFRSITESGRLAEFIDFENKKIHFPDVDSRFKFAISIIAGSAAAPGRTRCAFFIHHLEELDDPNRTFVLTPEDFALLNPNTRTCPIFRTRTDAELTKKIYRAAPILIDENDERHGNPWGVRFLRMFDMTNDSGLFRTAEDLEGEGFWLGKDMHWHKGEQEYLRLYQAKMMRMFDHRSSTIVLNTDNLFNPGYPKPVPLEKKEDPSYLVIPQYWVPKAAVDKALPNENWMLGFRDIARATDERTMISSALPAEGYNNKIPLLIFENEDARNLVSCLIANLNSMVFDYATRQKITSTNLNYFIVKQLPVLPPSAYEKPFKGRDIRPWIQDRVLELTYTAEDMAPFARDLGYDGAPFIYDEQRRHHLRCQLDALYFHLYGISKDEAATILDTFPIVRQHDQKAHGTYQTRDRILAYHTAYAAGDLDAETE